MQYNRNIESNNCYSVMLIVGMVNSLWIVYSILLVAECLLDKWTVSFGACM